MGRPKKNELRCRATVHFAGGVSPGDTVVVDPTDPYMLQKLVCVPPLLVPLEPWEPDGLALAEAPAELPDLSSPAAPGDDATVETDGSASDDTGDDLKGVGLSDGG